LWRKTLDLLIAIVVVLTVAFIWAFMTMFMVWQKYAPMSTGLGNALSDQYRESVERNLASQRKWAAFMRRTVWPVVVTCGAIVAVLIVVMNV
jgi:hypothetical protein